MEHNLQLVRPVASSDGTVVTAGIRRRDTDGGPLLLELRHCEVTPNGSSVRCVRALSSSGETLHAIGRRVVDIVTKDPRGCFSHALGVADMTRVRFVDPIAFDGTIDPDGLDVSACDIGMGRPSRMMHLMVQVQHVQLHPTHYRLRMRALEAREAVEDEHAASVGDDDEEPCAEPCGEDRQAILDELERLRRQVLF
jgi:hypothetical protein